LAPSGQWKTVNNPPAQSSEDETTGLPWPRSWPGVYVIVTGVFILWVVLLTTLSLIYS
jgi:hypothetical protein